jgi:hypothetical protein
MTKGTTGVSASNPRNALEDDFVESDEYNSDGEVEVPHTEAENPHWDEGLKELNKSIKKVENGSIYKDK